MRIAQVYSHLNGLEFLLVHKPTLWKEIQTSIESINAQRTLDMFDNLLAEPTEDLFFSCFG